MQGVKTVKQAGAQILVVGENDQFVGGLERKLLQAGYSATASAGFEEAVLQARRNVPALVLMDVALAKKQAGKAISEFFQTQYQAPMIFFDSRAVEHGSTGSVEAPGSSRILRAFDAASMQAAIEVAIERRRQQRPAMEAEQWLPALMPQLQEAVLVADALGRVVDLNTAAEQLTGWKGSEARGKLLRDLLDLHDRDSGRPHELLNHFELRAPVRFGEGKRRVQLKTRTGSELLVTGQVTPIASQSQELLGALWTLHNVTAQVRAEDRLVQKSFELHAICGAFPDCYFRLSADGTILDSLSGGNWEMNGQPLPVLGKKVQEIFPAASRKPLQEALIRLRRAEAPVQLALPMKSSEGERNYEARLIPSLEGQILLVLRDTTEHRQAQQALRQAEEQLRQAHKMEAIGKLAGGVAHDFNNLLTAITGYSDILLKRSKPDDPLRHEVLEIKHAAERATALTRQLLAFSRKQVVAHEWLDLNDVVGNMNKMLRRLIGEDIELITLAGCDLPPVKADAGQIEQVILNLVVNARDAMPRGGRLTIETTSLRLEHGRSYNQLAVPAGPYVMLAVSDTGCGMDADTQSHLFEPYFTTKDKGKGTGLGLSNVYGVVKQSGGSILVYSEPGKGTRFEIYLPQAEPRAVAKQPAKDLLEAASGSETILLVEDEEVIRRMVKTILDSSGYTVLQACHGAEALKIAKDYDGPIHLMLTDIVMPEMSGYVLSEKLSQMRPEMLVLYMSGYSDETIRQHGDWNQDTPFIHKPFTPEGLNHKIRQVLDQAVVKKN